MADTLVITVAGKNHQWMLKLVGTSKMRKECICIIAKYFPTRQLQRKGIITSIKRPDGILTR